MHLSFPPGTTGWTSPTSSLCYSTVTKTINSCMQLGKGSLMAERDVQSTFSPCLVQPEEHHLLGMYWQGSYFYMLLFGLWSAPFIFNTLAKTLQWIARDHSVTAIHLNHDDFFVVGDPHTLACAKQLHTLISLCATP